MFKHGFPPEWSTFKKLIWLVGAGIAGAASGIWKTITGSLIHITDALASPMQKCEVTLEPVQAGSGDPSPDNVRPITGWTGCEVTRTGANLFNKADYYVRNRRCNTNNGGVYSADGYTVSGFIKIKQGETYTLTSTHTSYFNYYREADQTTFIAGGSWANGASREVTTNGANYIRFDYPTSAEDLVQLELGSTATDYEPYSGTTLSVTFPDGQTVYGGTVDLVSGLLTADRAIVDMGTLSWGYALWNNKNYTFAATPSGMKSGGTKSICSQYPRVSASVVYGDIVDFCYCVNQTLIRVVDSSYTDAASFKTAMSGVQLVYELAEPTEIQLTPQEISTLRGENNVWGDGTIELTYKAQTE